MIQTSSPARSKEVRPRRACRRSASTICGTLTPSAALEAGIPLKTVSDRLGDASIATKADIYSHVRPDSIRLRPISSPIILGGEL